MRTMRFVATSVTCLLLLVLSTCHSVTASTLRGLHKRQKRSVRRRQLMMETPRPTNSPTTEMPTVRPSPMPSPFPSEEPPPTTTTRPTAAPGMWTPPPPTVTGPPTAVTTPPTSAEPTAFPTMKVPEFRVPLLDFGMEYVGDESKESIQQATEQYLLETMDFDYLVSVELEEVTSRRVLQESSQAVRYSGNAIFGNLPVPSVEDVQQSQTAALDDTESLQQAFDEANVNVMVQQVVVAEPPEQPPSSSSSPLNAGIIAGIAVGAVALLLLAVALVCWARSNQSDDGMVEEGEKKPTSSIADKVQFVKYTPRDFEPSLSQDQEDEEDDESQNNKSQSTRSIDIDEYSLSAASADSSVKKDPEQRRQSLLKKLALYQKAEEPKQSPPTGQLVPAAFFVPQAARYAENLETNRALTPTRFDERSASMSSLLSDFDVTEEGQEVNLLPPIASSQESSPARSDVSPAQKNVSSPGHSVGSAETMPSGIRVQEVDHAIETYQGPNRSYQNYQLNYRPGLQEGGQVEPYERPHDFPSTTWQHALVPKKAAAYSDGPSDEMNAAMDQDLTNFNVPPVAPNVVSPEPVRTPARTTAGYSTTSSSPSSPPPPPPPLPNSAAPQNLQSTPLRMEPSAHRQSNSPSPPPPTSQNVQPTPLRMEPKVHRASDSPSPPPIVRRKLDLKEKTPPRGMEQRRRRVSGEADDDAGSYDGSYDGSYAGSYDGSYDGSYASNGPEVLEDLNGLSDFLRERREAKRAQRRAKRDKRKSSRNYEM